MVRIKGFYLMGSFRKGKKAFPYLDTKKPFEFDSVRGEVSPVVFRFWKGNVWFDEWHFLEGYVMSDVKHSEHLNDEINSVWESWCKKHRRKFKPLEWVKQ